MSTSMPLYLATCADSHVQRDELSRLHVLAPRDLARELPAEARRR